MTYWQVRAVNGAGAVIAIGVEAHGSDDEVMAAVDGRLPPGDWSAEAWPVLGPRPRREARAKSLAV
jgi:hypothetical protein